MIDNLTNYIDSKLYEAKGAEISEDAPETWEEEQVKLIDDLQAAMNVLNEECEADKEQFERGITVILKSYEELTDLLQKSVSDRLMYLMNRFVERNS